MVPGNRLVHQKASLKLGFEVNAPIQVSTGST